MNAVPAKRRGRSRRVVMVVPSPDGKLNPLVLAAGLSRRRGRKFIASGGAPGGGRTSLWHPRPIAPVAKIVGPGNAYGRRPPSGLVFGKVGIDMIAGPSGGYL